MVRILLFLFFFGGLTSWAQVQPPIQEDPFLKFDQYSVKDGLSHNKVLDIFQDSEGYLWVATVNGLNRFDGYGFTIFQNLENDSNSLSDNRVTSITEDHRGDLWFGTASGLNRFDRDTQQFVHAGNAPDSVFQPGFIRALFAENENLWFETASGFLNNYTPNSGTLRTYSHDKPAMVNTYFYHCIYKDTDGKIWIGGRYMGIYSFNPHTESFRLIQEDPHNKNKKRDKDVATYFQDSMGNFWIGGTDGLYTFDPHSEYFTKKLGVSSYSLVEDGDGQLWIGTGGGLYRYNPATGVFQVSVHDDNNAQSLCSNHINKLFIDRSGNVWVGTNRGISIYRPGKNKFRHIFHIPGNDHTPISNHITSLEEDQSGNIWLGTASKGAEVFDSTFKKLYRYNTEQAGAFRIESDRISAIREDSEGDLWIGQWSGRGMNIVNPKTSKNKRFRFLGDALKADWYSDILHDSDNNHWLGLWGAQGFYRFDKGRMCIVDDRYAPIPFHPTTPVYHLAFDGRRLWIGIKTQNRFYCFDTREQRVNYFHKDNYYSFDFTRITDIQCDAGITWFETDNGTYKTQFTPYLEIVQTTRQFPVQQPEYPCWPPSGLDPDTVHDWVRIPGHHYLIATEYGLFTYDTSGQTATPFDLLSQGYLSSRLIKFLFEDASGSIWVGTTDNGLNRYFPATGKIVNYNDQPDDPTKFWGTNASCAIQDPQGKIWIGGTGVNIFDDSSGQFLHLTTQQGLPSNDIRSMEKDRNGNIWIATDKGLSCVNPRTFATWNYFDKDGLQDNEFSGASCSLKNGLLVFGGENGINLFDPSAIHRNENKPPVKLIGFKIFGKEQALGPTHENTVRLKYNENYFSFAFTALDFSSPMHNTFAYKLDGFDANWVATGAHNRIARYTNVDPGTYIFRVKAANNDGIWNETGLEIPVVVSPPFWKTSWFYGLMGLMGLSLLILLIRLREKKMKEQNQLLVLQQKLLRSQMNPHFIFNSLSSIQSFIFENNPLSAGSYLSQFAELIRSILYNSREEFITLEKEISTLKNYLELQQLRYNHRFDFSIEVDPKIDPEDTSIPPMLAQPFIENAIEHGIKSLDRQGKIRAAFKAEGDSLVFTVTDNGIGLEASKLNKNSKSSEHKSLATIITKERVAILNKNLRKKKYFVHLEDRSVTEGVQGTRVRFVIPLVAFQHGEPRVKH